MLLQYSTCCKTFKVAKKWYRELSIVITSYGEVSGDSCLSPMEPAPTLDWETVYF